MFKWVLGLCAAIYATLMLFGEPSPDAVAVREVPAVEEVAPTVPAPVEEVVAEVIADIPAAEPEVIEAALIQPAIQPAPPLPEAVPTETLPPPVAPEAASATPAGNPIWRVTARRVNLRAGPSTADAVVGQAVENDSAEVIELLPSGWAKVYILEQGTEAFMSAQFLAAPE